MPAPVCAIGEFSEVQGGLQVTHARAGLPVEVPYLRVANVFRDRLDLHEMKRMRVTNTELDRVTLRNGDLLVVEGHGNPEEIGRCAVWSCELAPCVHQNHLIRVRVDPLRALPAYVSAYVNSPVGRRQLTSASNSTSGLNTINISIVRAVEVPLPPLPEQRRIADVLDKADAIRRKRKEAIALTEEILRSAFLETFGDPVTNPKGWQVKPLGEVIDKLEAGWSANGDARPRQADEYGVLKISAVTSGFFRPDEYKAVARDAVDRELVTPRAGDLLFSRANTRELVAATCLVEQDEPRLFLPDKIWRVIPRAKVASAPYIRFLLAHDRFRGELTKSATGTSGSMLNVSMEKLRALRAPIPPFSTQERFADVVWTCLRAKALYEQARELTDELISSLVHRAFRGELTRTNGIGNSQVGFSNAGGR